MVGRGVIFGERRIPRVSIGSYICLGSRPGQRKDLGWVRGYAARRRILIRPEDMQQDVCSYFQQKPLKNPAKPGIIFVTHGPNPWNPE